MSVYEWMLIKGFRGSDILYKSIMVSSINEEKKESIPSSVVSSIISDTYTDSH